MSNVYSKVKIMKATFCMYDIVMKRDVRVEISIPGGTHVFAVDQNLHKLVIGTGEWNYVFMSSLLRSFEPKPCPGFRVIQELSSPDLFKDFLLVSNGLLRTRK